MNIHFHPRSEGPEQYVAEAEIHFGEETPLLSGTKLAGFLLWARADSHIDVIVPSRSWGVGSYRQTFALLRPINDEKPLAVLRLKAAILSAWQAYKVARTQGGDR